jgi:hypothetical protein
MLVELDKRDFRSVARFSEAYIADYRDLFAASRP